MPASDLLENAFLVALSNQPELHKKWVRLSHRVAGIAGANHLLALQQNYRLDLLLRQLEDERLARMQAPPAHEVDWTLEIQSSLSQAWVLRAYEVIRVTKDRLRKNGRPNEKVTALAHRLAVVRMPIAKGQIEGMLKRANRENPPILVRAGETEAFPYADDGTYNMPSGLCGETGAVMWWPVDVTAGETVAICRRDLSDEFLALFD
jgi:hypothetical protein